MAFETSLFTLQVGSRGVPDLPGFEKPVKRAIRAADVSRQALVCADVISIRK